MERVSHFEIVRRLGQGGMGEVFEAVDLDLGRPVALKFLAPGVASDEDALRRFEREARVAAALQHPHIATVFAFDRSTDRPFIVMELLGGRTLRELLAARPLEPGEALGLARPVAEALAYAHRRGVAHRDIKPENLMFDGEGVIKITDFGLARAGDASRLTRTGSALGTPSYMAPELLHGSAEDGAAATPADVFALGVTLYEMLAGELPFRGRNAMSTLYAIANASPRPLRELRPGVPTEAAALVARMLEKDPAARETAAGAAAALAALAGLAPAAGRPDLAAAAAGPRAVATTSEVTLAGEPAAAATPAVATTSEVTLAAGPAMAAESGATTPASATPAPPRRPAPALGRRARWLAGGAVAIALAALAGWGVVESGARSHRRAVALNNEGHDSLAAGRLAAARRRFEEALVLAPRYAEAKLNLAIVAGREGAPDRAAALYGEVLREHPRRGDLLAVAHFGLGELDLGSGAWPSAIAHLSEASRLDSARAEYPNNLAFALVRAGRADEALAVLRPARARFPAEPALLKNTALAWLAMGAPDSALAAADLAVRMRPAYAAGWLVRLECEVAMGDREAARASFEALGRLAPGEAMLAEARSALAAAAPAGGARR